MPEIIHMNYSQFQKFIFNSIPKIDIRRNLSVTETETMAKFDQKSENLNDENVNEHLMNISQVLPNGTVRVLVSVCTM